MSRDIFTIAARTPARTPSNKGPFEFSGDYISRMEPEMQWLVTRNLERDPRRASKEADMDTPEKRQEALEVEVAERERRKLNFHGLRARPRFVQEGWRHIQGGLEDEEIRVYTIGPGRRRFWGIKPAGIDLIDFWDQIDPEVRRYDDNIAVTWANPLVPPPVSPSGECPVIWAGQGPDPDATLPVPPTASVPPNTKAAAKSKKQQRIAEVSTTHKVRKSATDSPKIKKNTRKSLTEKVAAGDSRFEDQVREVSMAALVNGKPTQNKAIVMITDTEQKSCMKDDGLTLTKRPRGRPVIKTKSVVNDFKRPRGRPPVKGKQAKKPPKQQKTPTVKGNARITKSQKAESRPSAPSTHKMRTRREGPAEIIRLP